MLLQNWQFGVIKSNLLPGIYFIKIWQETYIHDKE